MVIGGFDEIEETEEVSKLDGTRLAIELLP